MEPGTALGPYRIDRELGAGGMGKVYAATGPDGVVALKIVHPHLLEQPGFFKRFLREADIGKSVRHDNVVRTLDCDQLVTGGQANAYLVMEYVEGQTLADLQQELGHVPEELCRHVAREICKGLAAIHAAGVVHRDLKPENVLITPDHVVKVMDLGVARLTEESLRLSRSGAFIGSVEYAAPEQFGGEVDHRSDLHSLGLLLYELSCGQHPYRADSFPEVMKKVRNDAPRRLGEINPQLSAFFEEVVHTLLAKRADDRFAAADDLLDVLEQGEESTWWHECAKALRAATNRPLRRIRIPRETAVYGREKELAQLTARFEQARSGNGQVVLIEGEAGIGKSRLVDELIARLRADGKDLNFLFGSYPPSGAAMAEGGLSTAYREQFGDSGSAPYMPDTPLLVPAFDALLSGHPPPKDTLALTTDSIGTCFVHATRALADERTTVVLLDDLHFAPEAARGLFTALALAVPGHRAVLVGTMRPGVPEEWVANVTRMDHATRLELPRLGPKDLGALLQDTFASAQLAEQLAFQIGNKSDGNPFFAFEIIRGLREGQFITQKDDGTWASTRVIDEIQIPSSVMDLVNARVADLSEDERDLLDVAACCGFEFDPALVAEALGLPMLPTLKHFGQIERRHRLVRASGRRYVFDHHQVQEALYASLFEQVREHYHAAIAEALESRTGAASADPSKIEGALCVELCEHFLKAGRGHSAARYLESAQVHLSEGFVHARSAALGERALAVSGMLVGDERVHTLLRQGRSFESMGRRDEWRRAVEEAAAVADRECDASLRARAHRDLGHFLERASDNEAATATLEHARSLARECGDLATEARATCCLGMVLKNSGRLEEAQAACEEHVRIAGQLGVLNSEAWAWGRLGAVLGLRGRHEEEMRLHERQLTVCREQGDRPGEWVATGNVGSVHYRMGRLALAREYTERALALSREIGNRPGEGATMGHMALVAEALGELDVARIWSERALARFREVGSVPGEAVTLTNLGSTWLSLGDHAQARVTLTDALALCRELGAVYPEAHVVRSLGWLADEESADMDEALRLTEESLRIRRDHGLRADIADSLFELGDLRRRAGDVDGARSALDDATQSLREQGRTARLALALAARACLPGSDIHGALAALDAVDADHGNPRLRWLLFQATGDRAHLEEAKRLLDKALAKVPEEYHESMRANVRVNREILTAWREEFGEGDPSLRESPTRAG